MYLCSQMRPVRAEGVLKSTRICVLYLSDLFPRAILEYLRSFSFRIRCSMFDGWLLPGREEELLAKKDMVLPTHTEEPPIHTEEPQEKRRRSPLLAGLAALCLVAAVTSYAGHSDEQTDNSRRLEVQEDDGEDTDIPDYDLPPVALPEHATVIEAEVDIPGPNSGEPESVSLIAQQ